MNLATKAVEYFISLGWTRAQAAGIAANLQAESQFRPDAVGDGGLAFGVAQWHPDRQANFERAFGKSIKGSTLEEQFTFVHWELTNTEQRAGMLLRACTTAAEAGDCVSRYYERPADREGEAKKRAALATQIAGELPQTDQRPVETTSPTSPGYTSGSGGGSPLPMEKPMGFLSLLTPIAQILFQAFSPLAQQRIAAAVDRHSEQPGVGTAVAASLSTAIEQFAQQATGKADPLEAVAIARQQPDLVQQAEKVAEDTALQRLKELAPLLDKSVEYDKTKWTAEREGKNDAADRTIKEKAAGLWDMTKTLVCNQEGQVWYFMTLIAALGAYALYKDKWETALSILAALTTIGGWIMKRASQPTDYRFDGTKESAEQSKAITDAVRQQKGA